MGYIIYLYAVYFHIALNSNAVANYGSISQIIFASERINYGVRLWTKRTIGHENHN